MSGLILLVALGVFITLLVFLSRLATQSLSISTEAKTALRWLIVLGAFPLMVADEMVGMYQFNALCKANGIESADISKARGRSVRIEVGVRSLLQGTIMPMQFEDWVYKDANTGAELLRHKDYYAMGGWLMRYTPLNMGSKHSMFAGNGCSLVAWQQKLRENQVTVIK